MKKRIIAVLLSSMLAASMPAAVYADFDTEDFGSEMTLDTETEEEVEEETEAEEATDLDSEEVDEDSVEVTEDTEDAGSQEGETPSDLDAEELFSDAVSAGSVNLNGTNFDITKTYIVPLTLKNAHNLEQDSAAVACPGKFGTLTFDENGTPKLTTNLRSVTVGTLTDYAHDFKVYQVAKATGNLEKDTVDATVEKTQNVPLANGEGTHDVPETISFNIPEADYQTTGVYLSMFVDAMGYAPDAYLEINYAEAKESGDPSLNFTTEVSSAEVEQFGNYTVKAQITVKDGRIEDVSLEGTDFKGTHAGDNEMYLGKAINGTSSIKGMKDRLKGLYMNDAQKLNDLDTVTGATYSSNAIKTATMNALHVKIEQEVIPDAPTEPLQAGYYWVEIKDRTAVVDHGLVGESKKAPAYIRVDDQGKMWLTYKMVSGTVGEPLYVLGYNGYYPDNDTTQKPSMTGVTFTTEMEDAPTIGENSVVTDITVPLDGLRQTYINNVYLYVEAMKNLDGEVSGVFFDKGKFNIDSTITIYWDTLTNLSEDTDSAKLATLSDGVYKVNGEMLKVNKVENSMSNNAINHNIKLTVKDGVVYANMNFNGMNISTFRGYLKNLSYYNTGYETDKWGNPVGDLTPVTVDSLQKFSDGSLFSDDFGKEYPNDVSFPLIPEAFQGENYIPMQVFVPVMEAITAGSGTQNVYLKLDYSTLQKTTADDKDFAEQETITAMAKSQSITGVSSTYSKKFSDKSFALKAKAKTSLSYKSSNTKVATVDKKGNVAIKGVGTARITITAAASSSYKKATRTVTVKVAKGTPTITVKTTSKTLKAATVKKKAQTITAGVSVNSKGKLSYKTTSGNKNITVNAKTGKLTVKKGTKKGTYKVKVKISAAAAGNYNAGSKTVTFTIKVK